MKIIAPFDTVNEVRLLIEAGADELYCGINSRDWRKRKMFPNYRHMFYGSLHGFRELEQALKITQGYKVPIYLCINEYLPQGGFELLCADISRAIDIGIAGFIIADTTLIPYIRHKSNNCRISLSCLNACFNSLALEYVKDLGVDRVILPLSQLTLAEIKEISQDARGLGLEVEVFINNTACKNVNANCLYHKFGSDEFIKSYYRSRWNFILFWLRQISKLIPPFLKSKFGQILWASNMPAIFNLSRFCKAKGTLEVLKRVNGEYQKEKTVNDASVERDFVRQYCTLCSIYFFNRFDIYIGKIGGRSSLARRKVNDVLFARRYLNGIKNGLIDKNNFVLRGESIYKKVYGEDCQKKECHHIEVRRRRCREKQLAA
ncbi:MAG: U32 family peptidase [Candidatus Omnitrophota bacterium]